jgi:hypothetical protein
MAAFDEDEDLTCALTLVLSLLPFLYVWLILLTKSNVF